MSIKKIIIRNWKVIKEWIYTWYKDFLFRNWYKQNTNTSYKARNRKKLIKIILNWKKIGYHFMTGKNKTLFINSNDENLEIYSDQ
jgi:hypothetical protein